MFDVIFWRNVWDTFVQFVATLHHPHRVARVRIRRPGRIFILKKIGAADISANFADIRHLLHRQDHAVTAHSAGINILQSTAVNIAACIAVTLRHLLREAHVTRALTNTMNIFD